MRAGLLSVAAASYLTSGRSLSRLGAGQRERVLRRVAALSPETGAAVEAMKAIVLLANGAEAFAPELLSRAQQHDTARPDAPLTITASAESRSAVAADAVRGSSGGGDHRRAGTPVGGAAHRPGGRRHRRGELRRLVPAAAPRGAALAR